MLAAHTARRWLLRNAADVTSIRSEEDAPALACMSLVSCLPALEQVDLSLPGFPAGDNMNCLLEALAWCPRLRFLSMWMMTEGFGDASFPAAPAFAKLRSLRVLHLYLTGADHHVLADLADALASLTGLEDLRIEMSNSAALHEELGQLKGLKHLEFWNLSSCTLEAGCFDLPNLVSLIFEQCTFEDADALPSHTALQSLTHIDFSTTCQGHPFFSELLELPRLRYMGLATCEPYKGAARLEVARLSANTETLLHVDCSGHGFSRFPLALTQLVALECLQASGNEFVELPAGITALSRLTRLSLGRNISWRDPLQLCRKLPLDVRALGDLSGFPVLRELLFDSCEVLMCGAMLGAARHPSLARLYFSRSHPAPECTPVVLHLGQALKRLRRRSVLELKIWESCNITEKALRNALGRAPVQKFMAAMEACGL